MSSNRLIYDSCAYKKTLDESVGPFSYSMYPGKYENCAKCRIELGQVGGNGVSIYSGNLVDLESDLRGQSRPNTLCPSLKYQPQCQSKNDNGMYGLPCSSLSVNSELVNQPSCQMVRYPPTVRAPKVEIPQCRMPSKYL
jgi:hypothetical protein